ncbi:hypothetical protein JXM67_12125 [candidate division WOR-3 bacterium]|nr:hypothetical protein [candidate division WOR-3 bacterium]
MKRLVILALLLAQGLSAQDKPLVSIHLELGKDTLALAEPTVLTVEITNHLNRDIALDRGYMFKLDDYPYPLTLILITPLGQVWTYIGSRLDVFEFVISAPKYTLVAPFESMSRQMLVWWTTLVPVEMRTSLEDIPPGKYKLYAVYRLPDYNKLDDNLIYSDTVEFFFLPLQWQYRQAVIQMDSLWDYFIIGNRGAGLKGMEWLKDSNTPYSEAAFTTLLRWIQDYDSLANQKAIFDTRYPNSHFSNILLLHQYNYANFSGYVQVADSFSQILQSKLPTDYTSYRIRNEERIVMSPEVSE